jgi:hypothetical protein
MLQAIIARFNPRTRAGAFLLGMLEFLRECTWADPARYAGNSYTELDDAYDRGRDLAHRLTFRRFDD